MVQRQGAKKKAGKKKKAEVKVDDALRILAVSAVDEAADAAKMTIDNDERAEASERILERCADGILELLVGNAAVELEEMADEEEEEDDDDGDDD